MITRQEILEGNKIIAVFSGGKYISDGDSIWMGGKLIHLSDLKYHSSWDWLMPVVESIIKLGWQFQLNSYGVSNDAKFINGENYVQNVAWSTPLLATYNVVVDFVKWHNKQKVLNQ